MSQRWHDQWKDWDWKFGHYLGILVCGDGDELRLRESVAEDPPLVRPDADDVHSGLVFVQRVQHDLQIKRNGFNQSINRGVVVTC